MRYKHALELKEYPNFYGNPVIDGKEMERVLDMKIEREIKPGKKNELNKVVIKYHKEGQPPNPYVYETLLLEDVKVSIIQVK